MHSKHAYFFSQSSNGTRVLAPDLVATICLFTKNLQGFFSRDVTVAIGSYESE